MSPEIANFGIALVGVLVAIITFAFAADVNKTVRFLVGSLGILVAVIFGFKGFESLGSTQQTPAIVQTVVVTSPPVKEIATVVVTAQPIVQTTIATVTPPVIQTVVEKTVIPTKIVEVTSQGVQPIVGATSTSSANNQKTSFSLNLQKYAVGDSWNEYGTDFEVSDRAGSKYLLATSQNSTVELNNLYLKDHFQVDVEVDLQYSDVGILLYDTQEVSLGFRLQGATVSFGETGVDVHSRRAWNEAGETIKNTEKVRIVVEGNKAVLYVNGDVFGRANINGDMVYKRLSITGLQATQKNGVFVIEIKNL